MILRCFVKRLEGAADKLAAAPVSVFETAAIDPKRTAGAMRPIIPTTTVRFAFSSRRAMRRCGGRTISMTSPSFSARMTIRSFAGSAVFLRVASAGYGPTAGCALLTRA